MRPNETDKLVLNYAPWSVPIGGFGLVVGSTEIEVTRDSSACSTTQIDGFASPALGDTGYAVFVTPVSTSLAGNVTVNGATPVGNTFDYAVVPLTGPRFGAITSFNVFTGGFTYVPESGFVGYDNFYVVMTDAQGRKLTQMVGITVGAPTHAAPYQTTGLVIDRTKVKVDVHAHKLSFPITMLPDARECEVYKISIRQQTRDCDDTYAHVSCFDVHVGRC